MQNIESSFYKTPSKSAFYNEQYNSKLMRFRLDNTMKNLKLKNPRLVLESIFLPDLYAWDYVNNDWIIDANFCKISTSSKIGNSVIASISYTIPSSNHRGR